MRDEPCIVVACAWTAVLALGCHSVIAGNPLASTDQAPALGQPCPDGCRCLKSLISLCLIISYSFYLSQVSSL